jgi:hypothetical protein
MRVGREDVELEAVMCKTDTKPDRRQVRSDTPGAQVRTPSPVAQHPALPPPVKGPLRRCTPLTGSTRTSTSTFEEAALSGRWLNELCC